jgi:hypothetical protein
VRQQLAADGNAAKGDLAVKGVANSAPVLGVCDWVCQQQLKYGVRTQVMLIIGSYAAALLLFLVELGCYWSITRYTKHAEDGDGDGDRSKTGETAGGGVMDGQDDGSVDGVRPFR